jgi:hypothetical protein
MRHVLPLGAIGLMACVAVAAFTQGAVPTTLSPAVRDHVKNERFDVVTYIRGLPLGVRDELRTLFGGQTLDIAEPGTQLHDRDAGSSVKQPLRRLIAAGCSLDHCLVYYERGGSAPTSLVMLFHWTPEATRLEAGGEARSGLTSVDEVRNAVLAGTIKGPIKSW